MRHLTATLILVAALAVGAAAQDRQPKSIVGTENMIRGVATVTLIGTYVSEPKVGPHRAVFRVYRHTNDGGIYYYCVASGNVLKKIKKINLGTVITVTGRHERAYLEEEGWNWTTVIRVNYIRAEK